MHAPVATRSFLPYLRCCCTAAASHPGVLAMSDAEPGAHTHLIVVCPSFNPCRLPLAWPYAADTKARLFSCKHYQAFLERFGAMHADKQDRATHTLFGQLDFIRGSLVAVTPGAAGAAVGLMCALVCC